MNCPYSKFQRFPKRVDRTYIQRHREISMMLLFFLTNELTSIDLLFL